MKLIIILIVLILNCCIIQPKPVERPPIVDHIDIEMIPIDNNKHNNYI